MSLEPDKISRNGQRLKTKQDKNNKNGSETKQHCNVSRNCSKMAVQCLLQKFTSCCIAWDLRMLHFEILIGNAQQEIIQTNKNGEFAGHIQMKLPWIPEVPG